MSRQCNLSELCIKSIPLVKIYSATRAKYPMNNKGRSHHGLLFPLSGTEKYSFGSTTVSASPNTVLFIPKGEAYKIELFDEESVVLCIDIELAFEPPLCPMHFLPDEPTSLRSLFHEAATVWDKNTPWRESSLKALVYQIISSLMSCGLHGQTRLAASLSYLNSHYTDEDFSVEKLADISGVSRRYFEKLFFDEKGVTPRDYIMELKMSLARELLLNEKLSVTDVAAELGYADVYHFSKLFKQKNGCSPKEYKRRVFVP